MAKVYVVITEQPWADNYWRLAAAFADREEALAYFRANPSSKKVYECEGDDCDVIAEEVWDFATTTGSLKFSPR